MSVDCLNCKRPILISCMEVNVVTGAKVCPECGYEGGRLSPQDPSDHQDEWDELVGRDAE